MNQLLFATGNATKLEEARAILAPVHVEQLVIDLDELQRPLSKADAIVEVKLRAAFEACGQPVFVEDVSAGLAALNGFPGPYIKFAEDTEVLGDAALYHMALGHEDKRVTITDTLGYHDGSRMHFFKGILRGTVVSPRGSNGWGFDVCVIPDGHTQTMAEMDPALKHTLSHRYLALTALSEFLKSEA